MNLHNTEFIKSAANVGALLKADRPEVIFAGRSNVGKSSVLNAFLNRRNMARVGNTPGKTIHVNYFDVDGKLYLVDLPGYGYARREKAEQERWAELINAFLQIPSSRRLGVLVIDIRHGPTELDMTMVNYFEQLQIPFVVVANKADKLGKTELAKRTAEIEAILSGRTQKVVVFSAMKGLGRAELIRTILHFVEGKTDAKDGVTE